MSLARSSPDPIAPAFTRERSQLMRASFPGFCILGRLPYGFAICKTANTIRKLHKPLVRREYRGQVYPSRDAKRLGWTQGTRIRSRLIYSTCMRCRALLANTFPSALPHWRAWPPIIYQSTRSSNYCLGEARAPELDSRSVSFVLQGH